MYSLALMTFDFYSAEELVGTENDLTTNKITAGRGFNTAAENINTLETGDAAQRRKSLWRIHEAVLAAFKVKQQTMEFLQENYDQFAIYFELMRVLKYGVPLVERKFGKQPKLSGPAGTIPSNLHAMTVRALMYELNKISPRYECQNEFSGLDGVFPVDAAIYHNGALIALVEVDGEFHYKSLGQQLRRKDRLKEFLYRCHYPNIPLYRMRIDQLDVLGFSGAGAALATWISKDILDDKNTE